MTVEWMKFSNRKARGRYLKVYSNVLVPWPLPGLRKVTWGPDVGLPVPWGWWGLRWPQLMPFEGPSFLEMSSWVVLLQSGLWCSIGVWGKVLASRTRRFLRSKLQVSCKVIGPMDVCKHCECRPPPASRHSFPRAGESTSACRGMHGPLALCS